MADILSRLKPSVGSKKSRKRVGRGPGSGLGKTSGKGEKGQKARTGPKGVKIGFEGGQMPLQRRMPKRGFKNPFRTEYVAVNVEDLDRFPKGSVIRPVDIQGARLAPKRRPIKILGNGEVKKPLTVMAHAFSESAVAKIEKAGGKAVQVPLAAS